MCLQLSLRESSSSGAGALSAEGTSSPAQPQQVAQPREGGAQQAGPPTSKLVHAWVLVLPSKRDVGLQCTPTAGYRLPNTSLSQEESW